MNRNFRNTIVFFFFISLKLLGQNPLFIPDTLSGVNFSLSVQTGTKQFIGTYTTNTYGYNGNFLGPTLILQKNDSVKINVTNNLNQSTTVHWHGLHVAPKNDGGPHQIIQPGSVWSPSFKVRNEASTFWYHPHGENKTELQVTKGLAGMIIIRDAQERTYTLPRRYKVDDFPIIVQSKAFDVLYQLATATHEDSVVMVNGTIDPFLSVPQQIVRFRMLNGSSDRTYNFGLSNNSTFSLIASDGGLLSQPLSQNRLRLSPGERAEILINLSTYSVGTQLYLKSYASELTRGIIGADTVGTANLLISEGYYGNKLNGKNFNILRMDVVAATPSPVLTVPVSFTPKIPLLESNSNANRLIVFTPDTITSGQQGKVDGPFLMNKKPFHMDTINIVTLLNNTEVWTLQNKTMVAHPFHIHDIQFYVLDINGLPPPAEYQGLKDVILVRPNETVRFITQFTTFRDNQVPYMYHCHLLHHEDDGMMGSFLVLFPNEIGIKESHTNKNDLILFPNPANDLLRVKCPSEDNYSNKNIKIYNSVGQLVLQTHITDNEFELNTKELPAGCYYFNLSSSKIAINKLLLIKR